MIAESRKPYVLARNLFTAKLPMFNLKNLSDISEQLMQLSENFEKGQASLNDVVQLTRVLRSLDKEKPENSRSISTYHLDELLMFSEKCQSGELTKADMARLFEITEIVNQHQATISESKTLTPAVV